MIELPEFITKHRIITKSGCWEWTKGRTVAGYGVVNYNGRSTYVHRIVASIVHKLNLNNPKEHALHKCDNPPCFNPDHLFVGSQRDNTRDYFSKRTTRRVFWSIKNRPSVAIKEARNCSRCGKEFISIRKSNIFCSISCKNHYDYRRRTRNS